MTELRAELTTLKTSARGIDPVRLRYIESLVQKAEQRGGRLAVILETKARTAIDQYRELLDRDGPTQASGTAAGGNSLSALNRLLDDLHQGDEDPRAAPLDAALRQQELELADNLARQAAPEQRMAPARREELRAARRFHSAMVELNADKVVNQAIAEVPEGAGPLNPQRLATRSLETMRDLSPHYLSRFVSYIDTLFWLEQADKTTKR